MDFSIFTPLASFLGLVGGFILERLAREEIEPYRKHLNLFRRILLVLIVFFAFGFALANGNMINVVFGAVAGVLVMLGINSPPNQRYDYVFLGMLAASTLLIQSKDAMLFLAVLILLYGFPYGSLLEKSWQAKAAHIAAFFLPFSLLLIPGMELGHMMGFAAICLAFEF